MNGQIPLASRSTIVQVSRVGFMRIYFVALGMLYLIIAAIGFTPSYQAHFAGVYHIYFYYSLLRKAIWLLQVI
jgi:hypothetical protein